MLSPVVVKRYAEALLDAAQGARLVTEVGADLETVSQAIAHPQALVLLMNPTVEPSKLRSEVFDPVVPRLKTTLVRNLLGLLVDKQRGEVLLTLCGTYRRLALESRGEAEGIVESAAPLKPEEIAAAEQAVSARVNRKVKLTSHVVPGLIGGMRVTVGSKRFDATLRSRLMELRERMLAARM